MLLNHGRARSIQLTLLITCLLWSLSSAHPSSNLPHSYSDLSKDSNDSNNDDHDNNIATVVRETIYVRTASSSSLAPAATASSLILSPAIDAISATIPDAVTAQPAHILTTLKKLFSLSKPLLKLLKLPITHLIWPIITILFRTLLIKPITLLNALLSPFKPLLLWLTSALVLGIGLGLVAALVGEGVGARVPGWEALSGSRERYDARPAFKREAGLATGQGHGQRAQPKMGYAQMNDSDDQDLKPFGGLGLDDDDVDDPINRWRRKTSDASLGLGPRLNDKDGNEAKTVSDTRNASLSAGGGTGWMRGSSGIGPASSSRGMRYRVPVASDPVR